MLNDVVSHQLKTLHTGSSPHGAAGDVYYYFYFGDTRR